MFAYRARFTTRRNESSSAMPPATLRSKYCMPSLTWIGERASRYASVCRADAAVRYGFTRVPASAADRNRPCTRRSTGHGFRIGEVERGPIQAFLDQARRTIELIGGFPGRQPIEQQVAVGMRSDVDEAGRARVAQCRP